MVHKLSNHPEHATMYIAPAILMLCVTSRMQPHATAAVSRMQQQQCHACNSSSITYATAAVSRMQQQQCHACYSSNVTHATAAMSCMQQQQCHACNGNSCMQQQQCHACNSSNVTHAIAVISQQFTHATVVAIRVCSSNNAHTMLLMQCAHISSRKINCGMLLGILSHASEKPACS